MRLSRMAALGATSLALIVSACSSGGSSPTPSAAASPSTAASPSSAAVSPSAGPAIATELVLGGPPECPQRDYCQLGLQSTYGLTFKEFKPLDTGGPLTVAALESGDIQVGLLFTSDPSIAAKGFVLLEDDKQLQSSDNIAPVVRDEILAAHPEIKDLLNGISAKLTQDVLIDLNKQVGVDKKDPADVAAAWLQTAGILPGAGGSGKGKVVVASFNFPESVTLAELYAQALAGNGFDVEKKLNLGNREVVFPALRSGELDILPEYLASALTVAYKGTPSTDPAETATALQAAATADGLTVLDYAAATDQNGFVVTKATADKYALTKLSDLAKPAP
jgi:osmoprotectant transport system substrate-binding protein